MISLTASTRGPSKLKKANSTEKLWLPNLYVAGSKVMRHCY
jgi:hypothetical protein